MNVRARLAALLPMIASLTACAVDDCTLQSVAASVAGLGARDCGAYRVQTDELGEPIVDDEARAVGACVVSSFEAGEPFFAIAWFQGIDSEVGAAIAGSGRGEVTLLEWDSDPCGGSGCGPAIDARKCVGAHVTTADGEPFVDCASIGPSRALACDDEPSPYGTYEGGEDVPYEPTPEFEIPCERPPAEVCVSLDVVPATGSEAHGMRWSPLSSPDAPTPRGFAAVAFTGTELIVWGGGYLGQERHDGGVLELASGRWRPINPDGAPSLRTGSTALWTGRELFVWGGRDPADERPDGALYDPATDRWRSVSADGAPDFSTDLTAVWSGDEVLLLGGFSIHQPLGGPQARAYDPALDRWRPLPLEAGPRAIMNAASVWTGAEWLVWGGRDGDYCALGEGAAFDPSLGRWRPLATEDAPLARSGPAHVWTGRELVVFGGSGFSWESGCLATGGGAYDPALDRWRTLPSEGDPGPRRHAVHTGTELWVLGLGGGVIDGGRLVDDDASWRPLDRDGAPSSGVGTSAIWTGAELLMVGQDFGAPDALVWRYGP